MSTLKKLPLRAVQIGLTAYVPGCCQGKAPDVTSGAERIYYLGFVTGYRVHHYGRRTAYGERRRWKLAWSKPLQDDRGNSRRFAEKAEALAAAEAWVEARAAQPGGNPVKRGAEVARFP